MNSSSSLIFLVNLRWRSNGMSGLLRAAGGHPDPTVYSRALVDGGGVNDGLGLVCVPQGTHGLLHEVHARADGGDLSSVVSVGEDKPTLTNRSPVEVSLPLSSSSYRPSCLAARTSRQSLCRVARMRAHGSMISSCSSPQEP